MLWYTGSWVYFYSILDQIDFQFIVYSLTKDCNEVTQGLQDKSHEFTLSCTINLL
jgi:hypothetical protein